MAYEVGDNPWCITCGIDIDSLDAELNCPKCSNWWKENPPPGPREPEQLELPLPVTKGLYLHLKSGGQYVVTGEGLIEADLTPVVFYHRDGGGGPVWVRPLSEFNDGRFKLLFAFPQQ